MDCCKLNTNSCQQCGKHASNKKELVKDLVLVIISAVFLILGIIDFQAITNIAFFKYFNFAWISVILSGIPIFVSAIKSLFKKKITSNFLISIAIVASIVLEILELCGIGTGGHSHSIVAAGEIAVLMAIGGLLEQYIVSRSKSGIERLISLKPKTALVKNGNDFAIKIIDEIKIGDIVLIKPNEQIPVDGIVVQGESSVDTANVTGEHVPVDVIIGSNVYSGTSNLQGAIEVRVTKEVKDMTIQKLVSLTLEAEGKKAPISRIADKWASFIVPIAIIVSVLVFFISKFAFSISYLDAFIRAVTVLVVFCPCALALATPTAISAGLGKAAMNGIIIKSGEALEKLNNVSTFCFDKTGTLTTGKIIVEEVVPFGISLKEFLTFIGSAESYSTHPLAIAITGYAKEKVKLTKPKSFESIVGKGIFAIVKNKNINIQTASKMELPEEIKLEVAEKEEKGFTVVGVTIDNKFAGYIALSDEIREHASCCINGLKSLKQKTVMLTGDNKFSAEYISNKLKIDDCFYSQMPDEKLAKIDNFKEGNKSVCMVGDGVNDAPSLALADVGIALGALENSTVIETADIAIANNNIYNVYKAKKLSRRVVRTIKTNIAISMGINLLSVILSLFGILNPVTGAIVHNISSLFVVTSSALILLSKRAKNNR